MPENGSGAPVDVGGSGSSSDPGGGSGGGDAGSGEGDGASSTADGGTTGIDAARDAPDLGLMEVPPTVGAFGDPCAESEHCESGWCLSSGERAICTTPCIDSCPEGYICRGTALHGEITFLCAPRWWDLCTPCVGDEECGGPKDRCLALGDEGRFCATACASNAECLDGFLCVAGEGSGQAWCRPTTGSCVCMAEVDGSEELCLRENEHGACVGKRRCDGTAGWSECDAREPAPETCDGVDEDCDGLADDGLGAPVGEPCFVVNEHGRCAGVKRCAGFEGIICDGPEPRPEVCNYLDDDCDSLVDEDFVGSDGKPSDCFSPDSDGDADPDATDCAPLDPSIHHGAVELCNEVDDDCDGEVDDGYDDTDRDGLKDCLDDDDDGDGVADALDTCPTVYDPEQRDNDRDGAGDSCDLDDDNDGDPDATDCDRLDASRWSGAQEICDGLDQDCDWEVDEGFEDSDGDGLKDCVDEDADGDGRPEGQDNCPLVANPGQADLDGDGAGDACDPDDDGDGTPDTLDCRPTEAAIHPGATELCNGADEDCDGLTDDGHPDTDGDGAADCMDGDDDGDGVTDEADNCPLVANADQADLDGDGVGDVCADDDDGDGDPDATDCAPHDPEVHRGAVEVCDGRDNDCNQLVDDGATDTDADGEADCTDADDDGDGVDDLRDNCPLVTNPEQGDLDADGAGDACDADDDGDGDPDRADCAPGDASRYTGATEICNGLDDDCSGRADDPGALGCAPRFRDFDGDAFGAEDEVLCLCGPEGYFRTSVGGDCNDSVASIHPGAPESCNGVDDDCDGARDGVDAAGCRRLHADRDGDGYGLEDDVLCLCRADGAYKTPVAGDCDDHDAGSYPKAPELCDGRDNDCDGEVDEEHSIGCRMRYADRDQDGHGVPTDARCLCAADGVHKSTLPDDCDDGDRGVHGAAEERCNGRDDNCDGDVDGAGSLGCRDFYLDGDGDGWGALVEASCLCSRPAGGAAEVSGDCDDADAAVNPAALEVCDGRDSNCDGQIDEGFDSDEDGLPDCSDTEECDGVDNDGDGEVDEGFDSDLDGTADCFDTEECDGKDNDGDGEADEGFPDEDGDKIADCVDRCPVYVDQAYSGGGADGSVAAPLPAIQAGVDRAVVLSCGHVVVRPGTYAERVDEGGHGILIESSGGPEATHIDGGGQGSVVSFPESGESGAGLVGFTVTGGTGTRSQASWGTWDDRGGNNSRSGGGVFILRSSPTIRGNRIRGNQVSGHGGGVFALFSPFAVIEDNTISNNRAAASNMGGGGVYAWGSQTTMRRNTVLSNNANGSSGDGGGIMSHGSQDLIYGNLVAYNSARNNGAGVRLSGTEHGFSSTAIFFNNVVVFNRGHGVMVSHNNSSVVAQNTIVGNDTDGLYLFICCGSEFVSPVVTGNVIAFNQRGVNDNAGVPVTFTHNDVYGNNRNYAGQLASQTGVAGNISADPLFVAFTKDGDYKNDDLRLGAGSPCIDAGPEVDLYGIGADFDGSSRPVDGDGDGQARNDMGAYERGE